MIDQLESELRSALRARADELPADAGSRVRGHDYRPRTRVLLIDLGPQAPAAFAGWSRVPTHASRAQVAGATADCASQVTGPPRRTGPASTTAIKGLPSVGTLHPVLTDTRGPFTFVIYSGAGNASASCISGPNFTSLSMRVGGGGAAAPPAGRIATSLEAHTAHAGDAYSFVEGHAGAGVAAVTLILSDGTHVQTTLQNGWLVAWWPGSAQLSAAQVTTPAGTNTQRFDPRAMPSCASPSAPPAAPAVRSSGSTTPAAPSTPPPAMGCVAIGGGQGDGQAAGSMSVSRTQSVG
jgi:hypothetical protein